MPKLVASSLLTGEARCLQGMLIHLVDIDIEGHVFLVEFLLILQRLGSGLDGRFRDLRGLRCCFFSGFAGSTSNTEHKGQGGNSRGKHPASSRQTCGE